MTLREKFLKETAAFIMRTLRAKGLVDAQGQPVNDIGSEPLTVDAEGRVVVLAEGVTIDDDATDPNIDMAAIMGDE
jgi:hypothetical protein